MDDNTVPPDAPRRLLIPQFSLRWLLGAVTTVAILLSIAGFGIRGSAWAAAVSMSVLAVVVLAGVHVVLFGLVWVVSVVVPSAVKRSPGDSPFARPALERPAGASDKDVPGTPIIVD